MSFFLPIGFLRANYFEVLKTKLNGRITLAAKMLAGFLGNMPSFYISALNGTLQINLARHTTQKVLAGLSWITNNSCSNLCKNPNKEGIN